MIGIKRNSWVTVYSQSPTMYSHNTSTLQLALQLCYKPLGIFQMVYKNKLVHILYWIVGSIFNSSMKKLPNLESSFLINDTSWTKTFKMMINLTKVFLQTQLFFIAWNQKQIKGKEVTKLQKLEQKFDENTKATSNYI